MTDVTKAPVEFPLEFIIDYPPVAASRPRVGPSGTYYEGPYKDWLKNSIEAVEEQVRGLKLEGYLTVNIRAMVTMPKKTKLELPKPDVDNYAKAVLDTLTKAEVYVDDSQVARLGVSKHWQNSGQPGYVAVRITQYKEA